MYDSLKVSLKVSLDFASAILPEIDVRRPQLTFILERLLALSCWLVRIEPQVLIHSKFSPIKKRSHRLTASKKRQRPPGPVAATLLFHQSGVRGQLAVCYCGRMTMWQNDAEVRDKGSKLSWQRLQRPYRLLRVLANLISGAVTN